MEYKNYNLIIHVDEFNTQIQDSYQIKSSKDMNNILHKIREDYPSESLSIHKRKIWSMVNEWRAHNLLYKLNIFPYRTKDVDLEVRKNNIQGLLYDIGYGIGSIIYCFF